MKTFEEIKEELIKAPDDAVLYGTGVVYVLFDEVEEFTVQHVGILGMFRQTGKTQIHQAMIEHASRQFDISDARRRTNTKGPRDRWGRA